MNKRVTIAGLTILVILVGIYFTLKISSNEEEIVHSPTQNHIESSTENENILEFIENIAGVKAQNIEIVNNPVGIIGQFFAPRESILNGVDYFLQDTNNEQIKDIQIDIGEGYVKLEANYEINSFITTPIELKIKPSLDDDKNLILEVYDLKFLDLSIANWIVNIGINGLVQDFFTPESGMLVTFNEGKVIIDKSNFNGVIIESILIDTESMNIDMFINLEEML